MIFNTVRTFTVFDLTINFWFVVWINFDTLDPINRQLSNASQRKNARFAMNCTIIWQQYPHQNQKAIKDKALLTYAVKDLHYN